MGRRADTGEFPRSVVKVNEQRGVVRRPAELS
jgi:hypothetical protein